MLTSNFDGPLADRDRKAKKMSITYYLSMLGECVGFSKFVKFEYSPKCPFSPFWPDSIHSPDIRQLLSPDSIHSTDIRQPFSPDSIHSILDTFADIRQNVTRIWHIRTSNSPFWQIWGEWPLLRLSARKEDTVQLGLTLDSYCGGISLARNREEAFLNILECILLQIII